MLFIASFRFKITYSSGTNLHHYVLPMQIMVHMTRINYLAIKP